MAIVIMILLWTQDELSFDKHHEYSKRIYRVVEIQENKGRSQVHVPYTMIPLARALKADFPEVQDSVRIKVLPEMALTKDNMTFYEKRVMLADPEIFNIFSFKWITGTPKGALDKANTAVVCQSVATKLFGTEDPLGQQISFNSTPLTITGVIEDPPRQSHLSMDVILSFKTFNLQIEKYGFDVETFMNNWGNNSLFTYVLLREGQEKGPIESKLPTFLLKHKGPENTIIMYLQNIEDIYLNSNQIGFDGPWIKGNKNHVIMLSTIAFFILLIACINFMNLTTAKSAGRAKEVGLRKVLGGTRSQLIFQFLSESLLITSMAMIMALALVEFMLPLFNNISGKTLSLNFLVQWELTLGLLLITLLVSFLAGSYPAFYLSKFQPVDVLKGSLSSGSKNTTLRKLLVVIQFSISIVLMIGTWIIFQQMNYISNKELGFEKENVLLIGNITPEIREKMEGFKSQIQSNHQVISTSLCSNAPGQGNDGEYGMRPEGSNENDNWVVPVIAIDQNYIQTFGIDMVQGHPFSKEFPADLVDGLLINETAARKFGWANPIGKTIEIESLNLPNNTGRVVGVVKDYYFKSLHHAIEPLVIHTDPRTFGQLVIRVSTDDVQGLIAFLEQSWKEITGENTFSYKFLDDHIQNLYQNEARTSKLFLIFSFLAIIIASMGLLGLASFATEQRTKEIGVRKILGASIPQVIYILTKDFTQWVLFSNLISWPLAWYFMNGWLNEFPYRISISFTVFFITGLGTLLIALITISYQVLIVANANPVKALKYE